MKYPKELIELARRVHHTPEHLIQERIKLLRSLIWYYLGVVLLLTAIVIASVAALKQGDTSGQTLGVFGLICSIASIIIVTVLSYKPVVRSFFDSTKYAIEDLIEEEKEYWEENIE